jgi:signal transduction histidine kinase
MVADARLAGEGRMMPRSRDSREHGSAPGRGSVSDTPATKENLADFAAHELRGPIHTLQAFLTILSREQPGPLNDVQKDFVSSMLSISRRLERLADDIQVMFAEGADIPIEFSSVDVLDVVRNCEREVSTTAVSWNVTVSVWADTSRRWEFEQDHVRLAQIVVNLLDNAVRNSLEGGVVSVSLKQSCSRLFLLISNSTVDGLTSEELEALFSPFTRGVNAQSRHPRGSGLGLAVVSHLVAALGGRIVARARGDTVSIGVVLPARSSPELSAGR